MLIVSLWLFALPSTAVAQVGNQKLPSINKEPAASPPISPFSSTLDRPSLRVQTLTGLAGRSQSGASRDSLKNGTIIGAVVGAVALGVFGGALCNALHEPGEPSCVKDTLRIAALGAAIGAGAGLAVDAARTQRGGVAVSVRFRF